MSPNAAEEEFDVVEVVRKGEIKETSTMKFPASRLTGERGRWRYRVISYGCIEVRVEESDALP